MDEAALVAELVSAHGVHTILLYGSRARGDATVDEDDPTAASALLTLRVSLAQREL